MAALQLALDHTSLAFGERLVGSLAARLARVEVGTPLLLSEGLAAVRSIRSLSRPETVLVADTKICDAGERIATAAFGAGADVVTVVGAALDDPTWAGVLDAAQAAREQMAPGSVPPSVLIDAIGWEVRRDDLSRWLSSAERQRVPVELCVHRPKDRSPSFSRLREEVALDSHPNARYGLAGRLSRLSAGDALEAGFHSLVVGSAVTDSADPEREWGLLVEAVSSWFDSHFPLTDPSRSILQEITRD